MNCPNCGEYLDRLKDFIINREGKNFFVYSCPYCQSVLKEKEAKHSEITRILFLIFIIPILFLFLFGASLVLNTYDFGFNTFYGSFVLIYGFFILLFIFVRIFVWKKMSPDNLLKAEKWNIDTIKQAETFKSKRNRYLSFIFYFLLMLVVSYPKINKLFVDIKKDFTETRKMDEDMKSQVVQDKAQSIIRSLDGYYQVANRYPKDFSLPYFSLEDGIVDLNTDFEKSYFGRVLKFSDFTYTSDEISYTLCFDLQEVKKCWRNSNDYQR